MSLFEPIYSVFDCLFFQVFGETGSFIFVQLTGAHSYRDNMQRISRHTAYTLHVICVIGMNRRISCVYISLRWYKKNEAHFVTLQIRLCVNRQRLIHTTCTERFKYNKIQNHKQEQDILPIVFIFACESDKNTVERNAATCSLFQYCIALFQTLGVPNFKLNIHFYVVYV